MKKHKTQALDKRDTRVKNSSATRVHNKNDKEEAAAHFNIIKKQKGNTCAATFANRCMLTSTIFSCV